MTLVYRGVYGVDSDLKTREIHQKVPHIRGAQECIKLVVPCTTVFPLDRRAIPHFSSETVLVGLFHDRTRIEVRDIRSKDSSQRLPFCNPLISPAHNIAPSHRVYILLYLWSKWIVDVGNDDPSWVDDIEEMWGYGRRRRLSLVDREYV